MTTTMRKRMFAMLLACACALGVVALAPVEAAAQGSSRAIQSGGDVRGGNPAGGDFRRASPRGRDAMPSHRRPGQERPQRRSRGVYTGGWPPIPGVPAVAAKEVMVSAGNASG